MTNQDLTEIMEQLLVDLTSIPYKHHQPTIYEDLYLECVLALQNQGVDVKPLIYQLNDVNVLRRNTEKYIGVL